MLKNFLLSMKLFQDSGYRPGGRKTYDCHYNFGRIKVLEIIKKIISYLIVDAVSDIT